MNRRGALKKTDGWHSVGVVRDIAERKRAESRSLDIEPLRAGGRHGSRRKYFQLLARARLREATLSSSNGKGGIDAPLTRESANAPA